MLQRLGLPDEHVVHGRRSPSSTATSNPTTSRRCSSTPASSRSRPSSRGSSRSTERLRGPGGCPWDAAQTHHSLRRHVLEEAYEVAEAIDALPVDAPGGDIAIGAYDALEDELGDLLFQVMIQSVLAAEAGAFTVADVARRVHDKLVRRHPHVFGDVEVDDADEVVTNWEQIKKAEKGHDVARRGRHAGLAVAARGRSCCARPRRSGSSRGSAAATDIDDEQQLGDALAALVAAGAACRHRRRVRARGWARRFQDRFVRMERTRHRDAGIDLAAAEPDVVRGLWDAAAAEEIRRLLTEQASE